MIPSDPSKQPPVVAAEDLEHVEALFQRIGLGKAVRPVSRPVVWAVYVFVNGFFTVALLALLAMVTRVPFVFPSLGSTAYALFFNPRSESSSPRNTLIGHAIALVCGYGGIWLNGKLAPAAISHTGFDWPKVLAVGLSFAATAALMILLNASHPPAGATTLIVSLGLISKPVYLLVIEAAVLLLTAQAFCINRLAGVPYPVWQHTRR